MKYIIADLEKPPTHIEEQKALKMLLDSHERMMQGITLRTYTPEQQIIAMINQNLRDDWDYQQLSRLRHAGF